MVDRFPDLREYVPSIGFQSETDQSSPLLASAQDESRPSHWERSHVTYVGREPSSKSKSKTAPETLISSASPSPSVSVVALASRGKSSAESLTPSPSQSASRPQPDSSLESVSYTHLTLPTKA